MKTIALVPVLLAATTCVASAQQTWIVDAANGPGTHFTDVPPALAASSDGDTIVVRSGVYSNAITSRGVTMLGEGNPMLVAGPVGVGLVLRALSLSGLQSGRTFVMRGFQLHGGTNSIGAEISACNGHVVLADVAAGGPFTAQSLQVSNSPDVTVMRSTLSSVVRADISTLALREVACRGQDAFAWPTGGILVHSNAGLSAIRCEVSICGGTFIGGGGILPGSPDQPGIALEGCTTHIAAGGSMAIAPGQRTGAPVPSIFSNGGTLVLDPSIAASFGGTTPPVRRRVSALVATPAAIGTAVALSLFTEPFDAYQLFASALVDATPLGALGTLWLDPSASAFLGAGTVGAQGAATQSVTVPSDPLLRGAAIRVQALLNGTAGIRICDPGLALLY